MGGESHSGQQCPPLAVSKCLAHIKDNLWGSRFSEHLYLAGMISSCFLADETGSETVLAVFFHYSRHLG
jgi:hypothetical protein